jgi:SAM-dependent methyltransferase
MRGGLPRLAIAMTITASAILRASAEPGRAQGGGTMNDSVSLQRDYYRQTAERYDSMHVDQHDEHAFALAFMVSMVAFLDIGSVLDIGSGTGRALLGVRGAHRDVRVCGIEPSPDLRKIGHDKGLNTVELIDGDAQAIAFPDGSFDLVCEFGALHHIPDPAKAVREMLRVSRKAIFISDCNNFGQGSRGARLLKQTIARLGLWKAADFIKTRGKGFTISEGDGLAYSYSVFNDYGQIARGCKSVHVLNTTPGGVNPYRSASHVALLGLK